MSSKPGDMKLRRLSLILAAGLILLGAPPAGAGSDNPYWEAESNLLVESIQGEWSVSDDSRTANLEFSGINVVGQETTFEAGWRTGWFRGSPSEEGSLSFSGGTVAGGVIKVMGRDQFKGESWSSWYVQKIRLDEDGGTYGWGSYMIWSSSGRLKPVRSEWRIVGKVSGGQSLEGSLEVSI